MCLPLLEVFVLVRPGESKPLLLGHLGGIRLALFLYGEIVFLRQPPYDGSQAKLLLDLLGQSGVQNPGIDIATWWAKPMQFFEDPGISLFGGSPVSNLPTTLGFRILISCCVQGHRLFCRPVSNRLPAKVLYKRLLPIMDVEILVSRSIEVASETHGNECFNMEPTFENVRLAFQNYVNDLLSPTRKRLHPMDT